MRNFVVQQIAFRWRYQIPTSF